MGFTEPSSHGDSELNSCGCGCGNDVATSSRDAACFISPPSAIELESSLSYQFLMRNKLLSFLIYFSVGSVFADLSPTRDGSFSLMLGMLKGRLTLGHQQYESVCECNHSLQTNKRCKITDSRLVKVGNSNLNQDREECDGASAHETRSILGFSDESTIQYVAVEDIPFSCVDGRQTGRHLYTPGGDAG